MNNKLLHALNRTQTFVDVESGNFISLPKDETDKPPVNADINGMVYKGKSTQEQTEISPSPEYPSEIKSVPAGFGVTSCGENLIDIYSSNVYKSSTNISYLDNKTIRLTLTSLLPSVSGYAVYPIGRIETFYDKIVTLKCKFNPPSGANIARYYIGYSNLDFNGRLFWVDSVISDTAISKKIPNNLSDKILIVAFASNFNGQSAQVGDYVDYYDIQLELGSVATPYTPYTGNTYSYKLEDINGVLHEAGDLPDGTADTYNRETGELTKRVRKFISSSSANWYWGNANADFIYAYLTDESNKFQTVSHTANARSNIAKPINTTTTPFTQKGQFTIKRETVGTQILISIPKSELPETITAAAVRTWMDDNIFAKGSAVFMYEYSTPQTPIPIKQHGKTYNGQVWEYNGKPKSVQYVTNLFTDADISMKGEFRKLGNRKREFKDLQAVNGELLQTVDGQQIQVKI